MVLKPVFAYAFAVCIANWLLVVTIAACLEINPPWELPGCSAPPHRNSVLEDKPIGASSLTQRTQERGKAGFTAEFLGEEVLATGEVDLRLQPRSRAAFRSESVNSMLLRDLYQSGRLGLSIEVFPPKTSDADSNLMESLVELAKFQPGFISCTYGAGGSTRDRTIEWCRTIQTEFSIAATAHFTCVGSSRMELREWLQQATQQGVQNFMALRGDPPADTSSFVPAPDGLSYANELVELIRASYPEVGIGVAGYPETHPEAVDAEADLVNLKRKVDAGADAVFTQMFYNNEAFLRFRDQCEAVGIQVPIIPGIMPITQFARIKRITSMCGTVIPDQLGRKLESVQDDAESQFEIGVEFAAQQCSSLIDAGVPGIHLYVLNRVRACREILTSLGLNPQDTQATV